MTPMELYLALCLATDTQAFLDRLSDSALAALASVHSGPESAAGGVPMWVSWIIQIEIVKRWLAANEWQPGAVGEGGS